MSYSRFFGFRSFENIVRDGRHRVPRTGTPFKIGAPVQVDGDAPGFLKGAVDEAAPGPLAGLAVFEHIQNKSDALVTSYDSPYDQVPLGQYAQMVHGVGVKVWFSVAPNKALYDGRSQVGGTLLADAVVAKIGATSNALKPTDGLVPDGAGKLRLAAADEVAWLLIEQVNPSTKRVEARFTF